MPKTSTKTKPPSPSSSTTSSNGKVQNSNNKGQPVVVVGDAPSSKLSFFWRLLVDPTFIFAVAVVALPAVLVLPSSTEDAIAYLTLPIVVGIFVVLFLVVLFTHFLSGPCVRLTPKEHILANWFLCNGVFFNSFLDVFAGQFQVMGLMSEQYLKVEPRYKLGLYDPAGQGVFMTSIIELLFQAPLCIATYYGHHHRSPWRHVTQLSASILHLGGIWWMYLPESLTGFPHLKADWSFRFSFDDILYYWFGYWFCGLLWTIIPVLICWKSAQHLTAAVKLANQ